MPPPMGNTAIRRPSRAALTWNTARLYGRTLVTYKSALADTIVFNLNVHPDMIDANLIHNYAHVDQSGFGVQAAARAQILASPQLKNNADNPLTGFLWFAYINTKVKPLDNLHCRRTVEYAADKTAFQTAFGGPIAGGDIASTVMPPTLTGYRRFDLYHTLTQPHGDLASARQELTACGQPNGFATTLAYRADSPKQTAAATAEQQALSRAGITLALRGYPCPEPVQHSSAHARTTKAKPRL